MALNNLERQDLRHAALKVLADRPTLQLSVPGVAISLRRLLPFAVTHEEVGAALDFLVGLRHAEKEPDPFGAEDLYQITAEGVLVHERLR